MNQGHGKPCYYCGEPCNSLAGNPGRWPIPLCHRDDPGVVKWHHEHCVAERLIENQTPQPEAVPIRERIRMALDSREFYELSQAYRHSKEWPATGGMDVNPVVVAWEALKQYILDNADPFKPQVQRP